MVKQALATTQQWLSSNLERHPPPPQRIVSTQPKAKSRWFLFLEEEAEPAQCEEVILEAGQLHPSMYYPDSDDEDQAAQLPLP